MARSREPTVYVVSNRLPLTVKRNDDGAYDTKPSSGGLIGALQGFAGSVGFRWYGWPGLEVEDDEQPQVAEQLEEHNAYPVFLNSSLADKHYNGFSNKILWPLLHYQTNEITMSDDDWKAYQEVNRIFAKMLASRLQPGDAVWVHDYHLFLMPQYLREAMGNRKDVKIGFFLHTVFPSSDYFRILPVRNVLIESLLHCDLIGFHDEIYTIHFLDCCRKILKLETTKSTISFQGRTVTTTTCPIGINPSEFRELLHKPVIQDRIKSLREKYQGMKLLISVDRLDYIKGILLRTNAFDTFLTKHPEFVGKVALQQIVIPSRTEVPHYRRLHEEINQAVSRVNSTHGKVDVTHVHSLFDSVPKEELVALYAASDAAVVSSIRDGFNVVALEYVTCQAKHHGMLILSEFAGAAEILPDSVLVNPWDTEGFSDAIHMAVTMGKDERKRRWEGMNAQVETYTSKRWGETFLHALLHSGANGVPAAD